MLGQQEGHPACKTALVIRNVLFGCPAQLWVTPEKTAQTAYKITDSLDWLV